MPATTNPYRVNVRDLMRRPGEMREKSLAFAVPEQLGTAALVVPAATLLELDLRFEGLHDGILVSGDARTTGTGECVRCLDPVTVPVEVEFQELFAYSRDEAYDYQVHDDHVDCEPVVRDAVVLSLPFQPVCREDCPGLDPETGERLADSGPRESREVLDPRWAALEGLALKPDDD